MEKMKIKHKPKNSISALREKSKFKFNLSQMSFKSIIGLPESTLTNGPIKPIPTTSKREINTKKNSRIGILELKGPKIK